MSPMAERHGRTRTRERGGRAPNAKDGARARSQPGRLPHPDPLPDGSTGSSLSLRVSGGPRLDRTQPRAWVKAWTGASLSCLIADRAYDGDAFRAGLAPQGLPAAMPARARRLDPPGRTGRAPRSHAAAAGSRTRPRRAQGWPRAPLICTSGLGFSVLGRGLDRDEVKAPTA